MKLTNRANLTAALFLFFFIYGASLRPAESSRDLASMPPPPPSALDGSMPPPTGGGFGPPQGFGGDAPAPQCFNDVDQPTSLAKAGISADLVTSIQASADDVKASALAKSELIAKVHKIRDAELDKVDAKVCEAAPADGDFTNPSAEGLSDSAPSSRLPISNRKRDALTDGQSDEITEAINAEVKKANADILDARSKQEEECKTKVAKEKPVPSNLRSSMGPTSQASAMPAAGGMGGIPGAMAGGMSAMSAGIPMGNYFNAGGGGIAGYGQGLSQQGYNPYSAMTGMSGLGSQYGMQGLGGMYGNSMSSPYGNRGLSGYGTNSMTGGYGMNTGMGYGQTNQGQTSYNPYSAMTGMGYSQSPYMQAGYSPYGSSMGMSGSQYNGYGMSNSARMYGNSMNGGYGMNTGMGYGQTNLGQAGYSPYGSSMGMNGLGSQYGMSNSAGMYGNSMNGGYGSQYGMSSNRGISSYGGGMMSGYGSNYGGGIGSSVYVPANSGYGSMGSINSMGIRR